MNSPTPRSPRSRSQAGGRRPSRPPSSHLHSDCPPETEDPNDSPSLGQRSISLTTLQPTIIQPRMAQLETLEAKMASIEVSLSSTPRRKKSNMGSLGSSIRSIPKEIAIKELEQLRNALRDKENIIQSLKGQLTIPGLRLSHIRSGSVCNNNNTNGRELSDVEKKQAEERLIRLKMDTDNKRLTIKNLKMALERLDITDNIDVRIQQAELEYQLGREELNLLTLLEETRALQLCLEEANKTNCDSHTLYSCINDNDLVSLHAIEIIYDPKSPRFGAGQKETTAGLWIDWALEETAICKGDRIIEVNGKIVLNKTREDLARLLAAAPDPAQIVLLRKNVQKSIKDTNVVPNSNNGPREVAALRGELEVVRERAEEAQRAKDGLRSDNIRLTHRISYLEEQVSELLSRKNEDVRVVTQSPVITSTVKTNQNITNINISSQPITNSNNVNDLQVFQKGPQVTALVANLPGLEVSKETHTSLPIRSRSSMSNVSNTHIPAPSLQMEHSCHKNHRHRHRMSKSSNGHHLSSSTQYLDQSDIRYKKHHIQREKDYSSETNSAIEQPIRQYKLHDYYNNKDTNSETNLMDQSYKKATKIVQELTKSKECSMYEKHKQKCITASEKYNSELLKHYNARKSSSVLDFRSQADINTKYNDSKSVERLDVVELNENNHNNNNRRLYKKLHDSRSVKSLDFDSDCNSTSVKNVCSQKNLDYTSEPIENNNNNSNNNSKRNHYHHLYESNKPRPTPPKKPIRLSLQRAQSLQSVETPPVTPGGSPTRNDSRKILKRNYKIDGMVALQEKNEHLSNGHHHNGHAKYDYNHHEKSSHMKWTNFSQLKQRENIIQENSNWC